MELLANGSLGVAAQVLVTGAEVACLGPSGRHDAASAPGHFPETA